MADWSKYEVKEPAAASKWDKYAVGVAEPTAAPVKAPFAGNPARNKRQSNLNRELTPEQAKARREAVTGAIEAMPGAVDMNTGWDELATPGKRKAGLHKFIVGAGKAAAVPFLAPAALAAPALTAAGLALGAAGTEAGFELAKSRLFNADDDTADLVGDVTGIIAGSTVGTPEGKGAIEGMVRGWKGSKNKLPIFEALKGAWEGARAGHEERQFTKEQKARAKEFDERAKSAESKPVPAPTKPAVSPKNATPDEQAFQDAGLEFRPSEVPDVPDVEATAGREPIWKDLPERVAAPVGDATPIPGELPSGRKVGPAPPRPANEAPAPAPASEPSEPTLAELNEAARDLGVKNWKQAQKSPYAEIVKKAALAKKNGGRLGAPSATPPPAPAPEAPIPAPTSAPVVEKPPQAPPLPESAPVEGPRTIREYMDEELAQQRAATAEQLAVQKAAQDAQDVGATAKNLIENGFTVDQLLAMTDAERAQALGEDAHQFSAIVKEMRSQVSGRMMDAELASRRAAEAPSQPVLAPNPTREAAELHFKNGTKSDVLYDDPNTPDEVADAVAHLERQAGRATVTSAADQKTLTKIRASRSINRDQLLNPAAPGYLSDAEVVAFRGRRFDPRPGHRTINTYRRALANAIDAGNKPIPAPGSTPAQQVPASQQGSPASPSVPEPAPEPAPVAPVASATPQGIEAIVRTPNQTKARVRYRISEADDLKTSFDDGYNQEFQPRGSSVVSNEQRVQQRMTDLDPESMGEARAAGDGAPITKNGHAVTRNAGTQALKRLYRNGSPRAQQYREWVAQQAELAGMTPEQVAAMKNPVLHRELAEGWDDAKIREFAIEANTPSVAGMRPSEIAKLTSERITPAMMEKYAPREDGHPNPEFVQDLMKGLSVEERLLYQTKDGKLSKDGVRYLRNAIFEKAYRSTEALEALAEDPEDQVKNLTTGLLKAAPRNAKLAAAIEKEEAYPLAIGEEAGRAIEIISHLRATKQSISDWRKQGSNALGDSDVTRRLVGILADESKRPNMIRDTLNAYVELVRGLGSPKQEGFWGKPQLPSKIELLEKAYGSAKQSAAEAAASRKGQSEAEEFLGPGAGGPPVVR